jgi:hypothetical protein
MVRRWATGCSKSLIVIGIVDMIAKAKVVFAMRHSLDGMVAMDALEHQAWLAVYTLMHVHHNMPRSWRWTPQTMGGLGWSRWWDVVNTRKVVVLLGFLQGELPDERTSAEAMVYREQLWPSSVPIMEMRLSTDTTDKGGTVAARPAHVDGAATAVATTLRLQTSRGQEAGVDAWPRLTASLLHAS